MKAAPALASHRRRALALAALAALGGGLPARRAFAQTRVPRIGLLFFESSGSADAGAFGQGMRDLGYVEGQNVVYVLRQAEGRADRLAALAAELVAANVDVIVAGGPGPFIAARRATQVLPIVVVGGSDPVAEGWARTLARPAGNATGLTVTYPDISAKRLALLSESFPFIRRVLILLAPADVSRSDVGQLINGVARSLGVELQWFEARDSSDIERAFVAAREAGVDGLMTVDTPSIVAHRLRVGELALRERIAWVAEFTAFGHEGQLMAYGADLRDLLRRAASHVDRILKGARPGDLPIERPTKLQLTLNRTTARILGLTFPQSLLLRADQVVD
jgi:putative ABC transport system substrate-binding protein